MGQVSFIWNQSHFDEGVTHVFKRILDGDIVNFQVVHGSGTAYLIELSPTLDNGASLTVYHGHHFEQAKTALSMLNLMSREALTQRLGHLRDPICFIG